MTKQLVTIGTAVMTTLLALVVVWQFRIAIVYVLISLALAATVRPLVKDWLGRGFLMRLFFILLYLAGLAGFSYMIYLVGRFAIGDVQQLAQTLSVRDAWKLPLWLQGSSFQQLLVTRLPPPSKLFVAITGEEGQFVLPAILGFTESIGGIVSAMLVILLLSIYWSTNQTHFERLWLSLLPSGQRKQARGIWRKIEPDVGSYIRSEIIQSFLAGLLLGFGYWALGSHYPVLLALIGALAWLVPVVGVALAIVLPLLVGLLTSVQLGFFMVFYTVFVLVALQFWVEPRLFSRRWENPILTVVLLIALADVFGVIGIIVAPPISIVCQILWSRLVSRRTVLGAATQISELKERQALVWNAIKMMDEPPMALLTSSMERLSQLIEKAEPLLQSAPSAESSGLLALDK